MASTDQRNSTGAGEDKSPVAKGDSGPALKNPFASDGAPGEEELGRTTSAPERDQLGSSPNSDSMSPPPSSDRRRSSKEWDASKVPPSRFQKRAGSIFSTAGSRDSHVTRQDRDSTYHNKLKEKGWGEGKSPGLW